MEETAGLKFPLLWNWNLVCSLWQYHGSWSLTVLTLQDELNIGMSQSQKRGEFLVVMGYPFGVLSLSHFYKSISVGTVANLCRAGPNCSSLLMANIHCLPGMEGGPVFDKQGFLAGILTRPLRQRGGTAEIQLVISWDAIATVGSNELWKEAQGAQSELINRSINSVQKASLYGSDKVKRCVKDLPGCPDSRLSQCSLERALSSVALVTVGDGAWASGIVLNNHGLILTNAHILEPWRFGRTSLLGLMHKNPMSSLDHEMYVSRKDKISDNEERWVSFPSQSGSSDDSATNGHEASFLNSKFGSYKRISVRLHHLEQHMWYGARVAFVSKGSWDVALLQIESIPDQLFPITPEFACPAIGSTIHVIGHGLLGPRSDISPSVSSGVLANVVRIPGPPIHRHESNIVGTEKRNTPVMLQTTAAVHPGASGGAVVNSDGHLIGLVTSPQSSILPTLEPIFKFSEKQDLSTLQVLDYPNELLSSVWALLPPPPTTVQTSPEKTDRAAKGSRFSKFLADQHTENIPLKDQKHLMTGKILSKI